MGAMDKNIAWFKQVTERKMGKIRDIEQTVVANVPQKMIRKTNKNQQQQ